MANKDVFEELGITNKEILQFEEAMTVLERTKTTTPKFKLVDKVLSQLKELVKIADYIKLEFEYDLDSAKFILTADTSFVFSYEVMKIFKDTIQDIDILTVELGENEDEVTMMFVITGAYEKKSVNYPSMVV